MEITEKDKKLVEKDVKIAEICVKSVQDERLIAELKEFIKKTNSGLLISTNHTTSGLSPGIMDGIIGNGEELYNFTRLHSD